MIWLALQAAHAHLMVAQNGTLNLVEGGAFLVLSLPVSAFEGVDEDGDGGLSEPELSRHTKDLEAQLVQGVRLEADGAPLPLEGVLSQLSPEDTVDGHARGPARQVVFLGRFALPSQPTALALAVDLWGDAPSERSLSMRVTRKPESQRVVFTPEDARAPLFYDRGPQRGVAVIAALVVAALALHRLSAWSASRGGR